MGTVVFLCIKCGRVFDAELVSKEASDRFLCEHCAKRLGYV